MVQIVASDELLQALAKAEGRIEIVDQNGNCVGIVMRPPSAEDVRIAKERLASDGPRYTTAQVMEYLKSLDDA